MTMTETLTMLAMMMAPAFFSVLGMAAFGSPVVAVLGELAGKSKGKVFFDKYGQQVGGMGLILLILFMIVDGAAIGVIYTKFPELFRKFANPESPLMLSAIAGGIMVLFGIPYFLTWMKLRKSKGLHLTMGLIAALASIACVALGVYYKFMLAITPEMAQEQATLGARSMLIPMATMYTILSIASAAGLSCIYLILRRNKDDFGRDYYNFSLKLAARWATIPMIGFIGCQGWLFATLAPTFKKMVTETPLGIIWAAGVGLAFICALIWFLIARNETPMRMKGLTFVAAALLWLAHGVNAVLFINFISMN